MKKFTLAASAAALALAATALYAAVPAAQADGDGVVTWAQAKAKADDMWSRLDVNKDGKLDQADRDAALLQKFDAIDTNHDGAISKDEFVAHHRAMMPQPGQMPMPGMHHDDMGHDDMAKDGMGGWHGRHGGMGHDMMGPMMGRMMADADTNKDGAISRGEYDAAVKAHFDKVDANHDGKITHDERRAAFEKFRPRMRDGETDRGPGNGAPPPPPPGM